jgi:hypothetical protein
MVVVDGQGIPLASTLAPASPSEFKLAEETLETVKVPRNGRGRPKKRPLRLIADKGYDSDHFENDSSSLKLILLFHIEETEKGPKCKMEENLGDTASVGKLNEPSLGLVIIAACW